MTKAAPSSHAFQPILRALKAGLPRLVIETGREPLILCFRRKDELIHDPECAQHFKAPEDGVFRRCEIVQGGTRGFLWTYYSPLGQLPAQFKKDLTQFNSKRWQMLLLDAAWQIERHANVSANTDPNTVPQTLTPTATRRRRQKTAASRSLNAAFLPRTLSRNPGAPSGVS